MAAPTIESSETRAASSMSGGIATINKPSGTAEGDLLILFAAGNASGVTEITAPAGFTRVTSGNYFSNGTITRTGGIYYKIAGSSEPASYDITGSSIIQLMATLTRVSGVDQVCPIGKVQQGGSTSAITGGYEFPTPSGTSEGDQTVMRCLAVFDDQAFTATTGSTLIHSSDTATNFDTSHAVAYDNSSYADGDAIPAQGFQAALSYSYVGYTVPIFGAGQSGRSASIPVYESFSSDADTETNLSVPLPAGTVDGDLLVATHVLSSKIPPLMSGWTSIQTGIVNSSTRNYRVQYKIANSEPASYGTGETSVTQAIGFIVRVSGANALSPIAASAFNSSALASSSPFPSITPGVSNCLLLNGAMEPDDTSKLSEYFKADYGMNYIGQKINTVVDTCVALFHESGCVDSGAQQVGDYFNIAEARDLFRIAIAPAASGTGPHPRRKRYIFY